MYTEILMKLISVIGTAAFAISGATAATKKRTDLFGTLIISVITATGGGAMRDIFLGIMPPSSFIYPRYIVLSSAVSLIVFLSVRICATDYTSFESRIDSVNNIFDAVGLGVFVVMGTDAAIAYGYSQNTFFCVFIGTITGIGGGVLRDILLGEIPAVLKKELYATSAILGSIVFYTMHRFSVGYTLSAALGTLSAFLLRIISIRLKWNLPPAY